MTNNVSNRGNLKGSIKIAHVNVENLRVHRENFVNCFQSNVYDIIGVSETFLKPQLLSEPFQLPGYSFVRHDREGKEGGGVAVYLRSCFAYKLIATSQPVYARKSEFIFVEVSLGWKLLLCIVYRPPKAGAIDELFQVLGNLIPVYNNVLILGDFNINLAGDRIFNDKAVFLDCINNLNLNVLPLNPTYHLPMSDTLLDLIICNDLSRVKDYGQLPVSGLSYHDLIYVELNLKLQCKKEYITIRDFKNIDVNKLKNDCLAISWDTLYNSRSIDDKVTFLQNKLMQLYDNNIPERRIYTKRNPCPWVNDDLKNLMKQRDNLYKRYVRTKDTNVWESYRVLRNRIKIQVRDARNRHFNNVFQSEVTSKVLWKTVKDQGAGKESKKLNDPVIDINALNSFFCGVNNEINVDLIDYYKSVNVDNVGFRFNEINIDSIGKAISDISSNAMGSDGIHLKFVKLIFNEIKDVLCHVFNFSLLNSVYPNQWKRALILPLPKISNPIECKHYRSINILCVFGKIIDKLVYQQMCKFVNDNNLLFKYQSGYRPYYSTQTALVRVTDDIRYAMDNRKLTVLILLDFSRAFDCIHHELLLSILGSYGFGNGVICWLRSYLNERMQRIKTGSGLFSDWKCNPVGVPQGSTLSALLFSLFINKICDDLVFSKCMLYADDLQLYVQSDVSNINNAINSLNADLYSLSFWCRSHGLKLNIAKCKPIIFGTSRLLNTLDHDSINPVIIDGQILSYEDRVVNLGLRMMNNLSWTDQVSYIHKKVFQCLYQFRRLCFEPSLEVRKLLVSTLIFPLFDYACAAFCDVNKTLLDKLQLAQNACIRYIFKLRLDEHVTGYYKQVGWLKIKERLDYNIISLADKILRRKEPDYLYDKFIPMSNVHLRQTRYGDSILQLPIHRTVTYTHSFHVEAIRKLNALAWNIRFCNNNKLFLRRLKEELLKRYDL